jgi:hypothetical protein
MLIWLGKQYLNQADKKELTGKDGGPIRLKDVSSFHFHDEELETAVRMRN